MWHSGRNCLTWACVVAGMGLDTSLAAYMKAAGESPQKPLDSPQLGSLTRFIAKPCPKDNHGPRSHVVRISKNRGGILPFGYVLGCR